MVKINFQNNITKANADTFNTMQDNIENGITTAVNGETTTITNCNLYKIGSMVFAVIYTAGTAITDGVVATLPDGYKINGIVRTNVRYYTGSAYDNGMLIGQNNTIQINTEFGVVPASASFVRAIMFWKTND